MGNESIILISSIAYIVIMFFLIRAATRASQVTELLRVNARLLARLLKEKGVSDEEILKLSEGEFYPPLIAPTKTNSTVTAL